MGCRDECAGEACLAEVANRFILLAKGTLLESRINQPSLPSILYAEVELATGSLTAQCERI
jgi:hypothetical protein